MGTLLSNVGTVITSVVGWAGDFATAITGDTTGLLIVPVCLGLSLFGIHILRSLMGR